MASNHSSSLRSDFTRSICTSSSERSSDFTSKDSATNEPNTRFVDKEEDPRIPSLEDVYRIFQEGKATWEAFLSQAKRQPDVNCNLVSSWLASVLETLDLIIAQNEIEVLLKVFLLRRPRIGIWWVAVFFLGDSALLDWIRRYAVKMEEKRGFGSLLSPDPIVSTWTRSKQLFIDFNNNLLYLELSDLVSRADLL